MHLQCACPPTHAGPPTPLTRLCVESRPFARSFAAFATVAASSSVGRSVTRTDVWQSSAAINEFRAMSSASDRTIDALFDKLLKLIVLISSLFNLISIGKSIVSTCNAEKLLAVGVLIDRALSLLTPAGPTLARGFHPTVDHAGRSSVGAEAC